MTLKFSEMQNNSESNSDVFFLGFSGGNDGRSVLKQKRVFWAKCCNGNLEQGTRLLYLLQVYCTRVWDGGHIWDMKTVGGTYFVTPSTKIIK